MKQNKPKGLTIVYTGSGKGKTTAALGLILRAVGSKKRIAFIQFIKGSWKYGEIESLKLLQPNVTHYIGGKGFVGILGDTLTKNEHKKIATQTLKYAKKSIRSKQFDIIICDEINYAYNLHLITAKEILSLIHNKPEETDLVLTGNFAPKSVIEKADLVTEMKEIKHPFKKGILAKKGIDF